MHRSSQSDSLSTALCMAREDDEARPAIAVMASLWRGRREKQRSEGGPQTQSLTGKRGRALEERRAEGSGAGDAGQRAETAGQRCSVGRRCEMNRCWCLGDVWWGVRSHTQTSLGGGNRRPKVRGRKEAAENFT